MIKTLYTVFLGLLVAIFVGVGVSVFYAAPTPPEAPTISYKDPSNMTEADRQAQADFDKQQKAFQKKEAIYNRNVSIIVLVAAVVLLALSFVLAKPFGFMAEALMFGGLFTLVYSLMRGMGSDNSKYRFAVVTACLAVAGVLGYLKFARPAPAKAKAK